MKQKELVFKIELHPSEWSVLQDDLKDRDFELICLGWGQDSYAR